jgi:hypothetical protein
MFEKIKSANSICDILGLTTDFSVSYNYGFEAAMMY